MATETRLAGDQYATVAASQTAQVLGGGATGGRVTGVLIVPTTTAAGSVTLIDTSGSSMVLFNGGGTLTDLKPFFLPLTLTTKTSAGVWQMTTGANVACIVQGLWA